ncbi:MAG TPA: tetratricopeptide repeat protein [Saprospiraceae bacterium]|nr:tetratricopeptide repeat protein [Saprospiraceae bacterium]
MQPQWLIFFIIGTFVTMHLRRPFDWWTSIHMLFFIGWINIFPISLQASRADSIADLVLALPKADQYEKLWLLAYPPGTGDTTTDHQLYEDLQSIFHDRGEDWLARQTWSIKVNYDVIYLYVYLDKGLQYITRYTEEARKQGWKSEEAECILMQGIMYYRQLKYGPAFEYLQKGYSKLQSIGLENSPGIVHYMQQVAQCYYEFGDYEGAIHFLKEAMRVKPKNVNVSRLYIAKNTLALAYQKLEQFDSAIYYFKSAHAEAVTFPDSFWAALANGNLGNVYYLQGRYDDAIPLMETDFKESDHAAEWQSAVNAAMILANIYMKKGENQQAAFYLDYGLKNINYGSIRDLAGFYNNLATISRLKGDYNKAFDYLDSSRVYAEKQRKLNNTQVINHAKLKLEVEQHDHEIQMLEAIRSRQVLIRNGLLVILMLSGLAAALWINRINLKRKKEQELAARDLSGFTKMLKEKNDLIESFKNELEHLQQNGETKSQERTEQLTQLLNSTILTEEDWKEFRLLFDKVYPGFFIRLKEKMSDLSPADTRLIALTKLQLAPKEMAAMLGLTYEAIKKSRQRLRKKINLPEEGSLDEVVELI